MAEEQQWARGYDGFTFRDPGTQLGSSGAQPMVWLCMPTPRDGISQGSRGKAPGKHHVTETFTPRAVTQQKLKDYKPPPVSPGPITPHQAAWRRDGAAGSTLAQKRVICSCWVCPNLCDRTPSRRQHQSKQGMRLERGKWQESRSQHHAGTAACCWAQRLLQGLSCIQWTQQGGQG